MFLKKIELFGFKSFADRTKIEMNDGITALLGPNGCGKSNIVDSIKWVLGEQSTKNMRAERMEDVIFSGTHDRKALNVAEVTLVISNEEGLIDLDLSEISVKRRLYRNGDSEYFLNNTQVRLKELKEVFYDTGIGKSAYSIMEQGKIDQVLSNKPEERRFLFEEAAGITRFKMKGNEAERKLVKTKENMLQVNNILSEVKKNYDTLKKQSEKTLLYRSKKELLNSTEIDIQLVKYNRLCEKLKKVDENKKNITEKIAVIEDKIKNLSGNLASDLDKVNSMESSLIEGQKKLYGIDLEKENLFKQKKLLKAQKEDIENTITSLDKKNEDLLQKIDNLKKEKEERDLKFDEYKKQLDDIERNITDFLNNNKSSEEKIAENLKEATLEEEKISKDEKALESLQDSLRQLTDNIVNQLDSGLKESGFSLLNTENEKALIESDFQSSLILLKGKIQILEDAKNLENPLLNNKTLWDSSLEAFHKLYGDLDKLRERVLDYTVVLPDFLTDFLAPEGIITQKREIDSKLETIMSQLKIRRERLNTIKKDNDALRERIKNNSQNLEKLRVNKAKVATQIEGLKDIILNLEKEELSFKDELSLLAKDVSAQRLKLDTSVKAIAKNEKEVKVLESEKINLDKSLKKLETSISKHNKGVSGHEGKLKGERLKLQNQQLSFEKYNIEGQHLREEIEGVELSFKDSFSTKISKYFDRLESVLAKKDKLKIQNSQIKEELKRIGQVNLMAPEEFAEVKERYDFLKAQLSDLSEAQDSLINVTQEIKKESSALFLKTYKQIKENFNEIFRLMFGGGKAELKLLEPDNILDSGIEIYAQPPGKKLENIALLSGGERSLTGVALLFATYKVKPSPFCILDEIDAALDEANIQRFINVLMEFGQKSQFIVITHNKKTVTGAKTLLGVTMQESGVSKLIAMKMGEQA